MKVNKQPRNTNVHALNTTAPTTASTTPQNYNNLRTTYHKRLCRMGSSNLKNKEVTCNLSKVKKKIQILFNLQNACDTKDVQLKPCKPLGQNTAMRPQWSHCCIMTTDLYIL